MKGEGGRDGEIRVRRGKEGGRGVLGVVKQAL